jgi:hypothetical protein
MERPALFDQMLGTLAKNNLDGWHVHIAVEPAGHEREFREIAQKHLPPGQFDMTMNPSILGVRRNPYELLNRVFQQGSQLNVYLEEDLVVSPDVLAMALWYQRNHQDHWLLMNLLAGPCGITSYLSNPNYPNTLFEAKTSNSLGFVMRSEEWNALPRGLWMAERYMNWREFWQRGLEDWGWDWAIYSFLAKHPRYVSVQPAFARASHNGPEGTFSRKEFHDKAFGRLPVCNVAVSDFNIASQSQLPHELYSHLLAHQQLCQFYLNEEAKLVSPRVFANRCRVMLRHLKARFSKRSA